MCVRERDFISGLVIILLIIAAVATGSMWKGQKSEVKKTLLQLETNRNDINSRKPAKHGPPPPPHYGDIGKLTSRNLVISCR